MIDRMGAEYADRLSSPRLLKTHMTWDDLPKNPKAKYIFCVRNPKDCLVRLILTQNNFSFSALIVIYFERLIGALFSVITSITRTSRYTTTKKESLIISSTFSTRKI